MRRRPEIFTHYHCTDGVIQIHISRGSRSSPKQFYEPERWRETETYLFDLWRDWSGKIFCIDFAFSEEFASSVSSRNLLRDDMKALAVKCDVPTIRKVDLWGLIYTVMTAYGHALLQRTVREEIEGEDADDDTTDSQ